MRRFGLRKRLILFWRGWLSNRWGHVAPSTNRLRSRAVAATAGGAATHTRKCAWARAFATCRRWDRGKQSYRGGRSRGADRRIAALDRADVESRERARRAEAVYAA